MMKSALAYVKGRSRGDYVSGSFRSVVRLSERLNDSTGSSDRGLPMDMIFHTPWRNQECPMMEWYKKQTSATEFRSIEHRRDMEPPFYHEFLIMKLTDNAVCRVERVGQGSEADAVRLKGCPSRDIIQWFHQDKSNLASANSELLAEADFGRTFDLMDVLAICYGIQNTQACRVYTLQRYNCYFLCLSILAILARQVVDWDTGPRPDDWDSCATAVLDSLSEIPPEALDRSCIRQLCTMLAPEDPQLSKDVFGALRQHMTAESGCLARYIDAFETTLWKSSIEPTISRVMEERSQLAVQALLKTGTPFATKLHNLFGPGADVETQGDILYRSPEDYNSTALGSQLTVVYDQLMKEYDQTSRMRAIEQPASFHKSVIGRMVYPLPLMKALARWINLRQQGHLSLDNLQKYAYHKSLVKHGIRPYSRILLDQSLDPDKYQTLHEEIFGWYGSSRRSPAVITALINAAHASGAGNPSASEVSAMLDILLGGSSLAILLNSVVTTSLSSGMHSLMETKQKPLKIRMPSKVEFGFEQEDIGVAEFHVRYIEGRIMAHARRVELYQLAAASLVYQDIKRAMEEVWGVVVDHCRTLAFDTQSEDMFTMSYFSTSPLQVQAYSDDFYEKTWFTTPPLDLATINRIAQIQLITKSRDQGWITHAANCSHSWFYVAIMENAEEDQPRKLENGESLQWYSHTNHVAGEEYVRLKGKVFDNTDSIVTQLLPGNCLGARLVTQTPGWENNALEGHLDIKFSPQSATLRMRAVPQEVVL